MEIDRFLRKDGTSFTDTAVPDEEIFYDGKYYYTIKNEVKYIFRWNTWMEV